MKKAILLIPILIILTGCSSTQETIEKNKEIYIDNETCVEYFANYTYYGNYVITPKYNQDGTIKLNEECMKNKGE